MNSLDRVAARASVSASAKQTSSKDKKVDPVESLVKELSKVKSLMENSKREYFSPNFVENLEEINQKLHRFAANHVDTSSADRMLEDIKAQHAAISALYKDFLQPEDKLFVTPKLDEPEVTKPKSAKPDFRMVELTVRSQMPYMEQRINKQLSTQHIPTLLDKISEDYKASYENDPASAGRKLAERLKTLKDLGLLTAEKRNEVAQKIFSGLKDKILDATVNQVKKDPSLAPEIINGSLTPFTNFLNERDVHKIFSLEAASAPEANAPVVVNSQEANASAPVNSGSSYPKIFAFLAGAAGAAYVAAQKFAPEKLNGFLSSLKDGANSISKAISDKVSSQSVEGAAPSSTSFTNALKGFGTKAKDFLTSEAFRTYAPIAVAVVALGYAAYSAYQNSKAAKELHIEKLEPSKEERQAYFETLEALNKTYSNALTKLLEKRTAQLNLRSIEREKLIKGLLPREALANQLYDEAIQSRIKAALNGEEISATYQISEETLKKLNDLKALKVQDEQLTAEIAEAEEEAVMVLEQLSVLKDHIVELEEGQQAKLAQSESALSKIHEAIAGVRKKLPKLAV